MDREALFFVWLYDTYGVRSATPFPLRCAVLHTWTRPGRIWAGTLPYRHGHQLQVRTEVGRGSKEKLPTQQSTGSPGARGERGVSQAGFLCWSGNQLWFFFTTLFNKPGQTATPTPAHRSSVEPLLSQPHSVSCNWIFLPLYSTSVFVFWLFFKVFSQTIPPVSQGSSKL